MIVSVARRVYSSLKTFLEIWQIVFGMMVLIYMKCNFAIKFKDSEEQPWVHHSTIPRGSVRNTLIISNDKVVEDLEYSYSISAGPEGVGCNHFQ